MIFPGYSAADFILVSLALCKSTCFFHMMSMAPGSACIAFHSPSQAVFFGLLNDLFPSIDPERLVNDSLNACVREVCEDMNLWPDDAFVLKVGFIFILGF